MLEVAVSVSLPELYSDFDGPSPTYVASNELMNQKISD